MDIRIIDECYTEVTREAVEAEWDRDDTREEHTIVGISIPKKKSYFDLTVGFDVEPKKTYYLVYVLYDTGDSFGHDENRIQFVDLFQSEAVANDLKKLIEKDDRDPKKTSSLNYVNELGNKVVYSKSWEGYFERFKSCYVQAVSLVPGS